MLKLKKFFIKRAIKKEIQLVKNGIHELGKTFSPKRIPVKIKRK